MASIEIRYNSSPYITGEINASIILESFLFWSWRLGVSYSSDRFFSHINWDLWVIHKRVMNLDRAENLLVNKYPTHPISRLWSSITSLRWRPLIKLPLSKFIRVLMCFNICMPLILMLLIPSLWEVLATIPIWSLCGMLEACRELYSAVYSTWWNCSGDMVVATWGYSNDLLMLIWK